MEKITITIDGPTASGKGTTSALLAEKLGYQLIDSGAMYRMSALFFNRLGIDARDSDQIALNINDLHIGFDEHGHALLNGENVEHAIRNENHGSLTAPYTRNLNIRSHVTGTIQKMIQDGGYVLDGRDAGSVIAPDAELKIYLDCDLDERVRRRASQDSITDPQELEAIKKDIAERDYIDTHKGEFSLRVLPESVIVDTTHMTIDEQLEQVHTLAQERIQEKNQEA